MSQLPDMERGDIVQRRGPARTEKTMATGRLEAFSDGVFAIAITLLVLELSIGSSGTAIERVLAAWPFYLAYIVSFLTIGAAWLAHTGITHRLIKVDANLLRLNLLLLLFVSLLPFPRGSWPRVWKSSQTSVSS